jgi:hypothetical protein
MLVAFMGEPMAGFLRLILIAEAALLVSVAVFLELASRSHIHHPHHHLLWLAIGFAAGVWLGIQLGRRERATG